MKHGRIETVPGQLASGQTLRFDPFRFCGVVIAERPQIYEIIPFLFRKTFFEILELTKRVIALNCKTDPAAFRLKDFCCLVHLPDSRGEHSQRDNAFQVPR